MIFLDLIIAHLLGDFVFQSNDLIQKKYKTWVGTFQHVCIITLFTVLALMPYWEHRETWVVVGTIFGVHFVQDWLKIAYDINFNQKKSTLPFFVDQILHVTLIYFLSPMLEGLAPLALPAWLMLPYANEILAVYAMGVILFSFTYDITLYQFTRQKSKKPLEYKPDYKGMRSRLGIYTLIYLITVILIVGGRFM
jgi:hypothetical protein